MKWLRRLIESASAILIAAAIVGAFVSLIAVDYAAYKERFPNAAWWSYLFK